MVIGSCSLGRDHTIVIAKDKSGGDRKVFGFGSNQKNMISEEEHNDVVKVPTEIKFFSKSKPDNVYCGM